MEGTQPIAIADTEGNRINHGSYSRAEPKGMIPPQFGPTIATLPPQFDTRTGRRLVPRKFGVGEYPPEHKPGKGGSSTQPPRIVYPPNPQAAWPEWHYDWHPEYPPHPSPLDILALNTAHEPGMWGYSERTGQVQVGFY